VESLANFSIIQRAQRLERCGPSNVTKEKADVKSFSRRWMDSVHAPDLTRLSPAILPCLRLGVPREVRGEVVVESLPNGVIRPHLRVLSKVCRESSRRTAREDLLRGRRCEHNVLPVRLMYSKMHH